MPIFITAELLAKLEADVQIFMSKAEQLKQYDGRMLSKQPAPDKWSVAQVLAHLNSYNRYYLPHIEAAIKASGKPAPKASFKPGWLGDYFTKTMYSSVVDKKEVTNKMKAPKDHTPVAVQDVDTVISEFLAGGQKLLALINQAKQVNIAKIKVPISIARWVKISLGDTLRFLIAHQERHFLQVSNTLKAVGSLDAPLKVLVV